MAEASVGRLHTGDLEGAITTAKEVLDVGRRSGDDLLIVLACTTPRMGSGVHERCAHRSQDGRGGDHGESSVVGPKVAASRCRHRRRDDPRPETTGR